MNLNMQGLGGAPQNLPAHDNHIVTGPMGDCVSIIVLYNYNLGMNRYVNARGWHGLGGAQVINMVAMLAGVPNVALTQVIIIPGSLQQSNYAQGQTMAHVQAGLGGHGNVNVRYVAGRSNATVNRQGVIT
jgi:hypothetical protein